MIYAFISLHNSYTGGDGGVFGRVLPWDNEQT